MRVPIVLFALCLAAAAATGAVPALAAYQLAAALLALASLAILLIAALRRPRAPVARGRSIVVDGSNVMHWLHGSPQLKARIDAIADLRSRGYEPGVVFDANAGYRLAGAYLHDGALARHLGLREDNVMVVPRGTQADAYLLRAARELGARIVTNDRYRDWAETYPEVGQPGHLVRGSYRNGSLWLNLEGDESARPVAAEPR